jgi:hypothetical protein
VGSNPIGSTNFRRVMSFHVYILESESSGRFYVGQTQDLDTRNQVSQCRIFACTKESRSLEASSHRGICYARRSDAAGTRHQATEGPSLHQTVAERVPVKPGRSWVRIPSAPPNFQAVAERVSVTSTGKIVASNPIARSITETKLLTRDLAPFQHLAPIQSRRDARFSVPACLLRVSAHRQRRARIFGELCGHRGDVADAVRQPMQAPVHRFLYRLLR